MRRIRNSVLKKIVNIHYSLFIIPNSRAGFTLVELLIVIAILGILSTAVLSAINPIEQINRGRDTGTQSDAEQLLSAIQRFNAAQGYFPWQTAVGDQILGTGVGCTTASCTDFTIVGKNADPKAIDFTAATQTGGWTVDGGTWDLKTDGSTAGLAKSNVFDALGPTGKLEILLAYIQRVTSSTSNRLFVFNDGTSGDSTYVCFVPQSNSFRQQAANRWTGAPCTTACTGAAVPADLAKASTAVWQAKSTDKKILYCLP